MGRDGRSPSARGLGRGQVAELLGVAEHDVAKLDGRQLHPTRASDRSWKYDPAEVRALLDARLGIAGPRLSSGADGETTAAVFTLFEEGKALPQVVIATRQTATVITALRGEYDRMIGSITFDGAAVAELAAVLGRVPRTAAETCTLFRARLDAARRDALEDATDFGEVFDPRTGERKRVVAATPDAGPGIPGGEVPSKLVPPCPAADGALRTCVKEDGDGRRTRTTLGG